jgi:glycosyltransferase involved in cell wall biosynthesis
MDTVKRRRVLIGTACYDGRVDVWYANSMLETVKMGLQLGIDVFPIYLSYDALIQRARNDLLAMALELECDDLVFIDSDIEWKPEDFFQLLAYPVDVVGGTYPKKGDAEIYVAKILDSSRVPDPATGLIEVEGLGTGFLRMSKLALTTLWENSVPYEEKETNKVRRWVFDVIVHGGELISEDIYVCEMLREAGIKVWLDPKITCNHIGMKKYTGNFDIWYKSLQSTIKNDSIKALYS